MDICLCLCGVAELVYSAAQHQLVIMQNYALIQQVKLEAKVHIPFSAIFFQSFEMAALT
jgi:hypothetical protein